jgi:hypothetical protein
MSDTSCSVRPLRAKRWTRAKMVAFLHAFRESNSVSQAAASVGMSRQSAYKLRARLASAPPGSAGAAFVACWNMARSGAAPERSLGPRDVPWLWS